MNQIYVVYLTIYRGNKLPPFYIGYTTEIKIKKGYNGSVSSKKYVSVWKEEQKGNPHLFKTVILQRFKTDTEALEREEFLQRFFDVPNNPMFINMAISRKGFGAAGENASRFGRGQELCGERNPNFGRHLSEETKQKIRDKATGRISPLKGIKRPHLSEMNKSRKGVKGHPRPDLVERNKKGHSEFTKHKIGAANRGRSRPDLSERNRNRLRTYVGT